MIRGFKKEKKEKRSATSKNPYEFLPSIYSFRIHWDLI